MKKLSIPSGYERTFFEGNFSSEKFINKRMQTNKNFMMVKEKLLWLN